MLEGVNKLFDALWQQYIKITPSALKVHQLLSVKNTIHNDHIALRTFDHPKVNLNKLAQHFESLGYIAKGDYHFTQKKLVAKHYEHPTLDVPKVFISELITQSFSPTIQKIIQGLVDQLKPSYTDDAHFLYSGQPWQISLNDYNTLKQQSEYAAWLAVWGYRANHFTVSINHLTTYDCIVALNQMLKNEGFKLNSIAGEVKGSPQLYLEQSATIADEVDVILSGKTVTIPSCFYEFAKRYPLPNGHLYQGFVEASADKIFQSTDKN